jgi:hypothetical protein
MKKRRRDNYVEPRPDWLWCLDSHDKLARFGIEIYGCVDVTASVKMIRFSYSNKDTKDEEEERELIGERRPLYQVLHAKSTTALVQGKFPGRATTDPGPALGESIP